MKIAICDDVQAQRVLLEKYITEWGKEAGQDVQIAVFASGEEFLFHWEDDKDYDLLVLDIEMGEMNGMELARKLRQENDSVGILFVTGFDQYMAQGYEVDALHYLLKPIQKEKLFEVLNRAVKKTVVEEKHLFLTKEGMVSFPLSDIWYVEAKGHNTVLCLAQKEYEMLQGISAMREELERAGIFGQTFVLIHRSFLVNLKHVSAIQKTEVILDDGRRLPISRSMIKEVNRAFIKYYRARN